MFLERWLNPTPKQDTTPAAWLSQKAAERGFASNIFYTVARTGELFGSIT